MISYFNEVVEQLLSKETIQLFLDNGDVRAEPNVRRQILNHAHLSFDILSDKLRIKDMEFIKSKLAYSGKTQKALYEHDRNCWQRYIFEEMIEDCDGDRELAKINSQPKSVYSYWKIAPIGGNRKKKSCRCILTDIPLQTDRTGRICGIVLSPF